MMTTGDRVEFSFWEAGSMIWVGSLDAYQTFCRAWCLIEDNVIKTDREVVHHLILDRQAIMPMALYQDDGYRTRVVFGDLNHQEQANWLSRAAWQLRLPKGQLVISGVVDGGIDRVPALAEADPGDLLQCYVEVPPGRYAVTVYAYLPDLTGGWIDAIQGKVSNAMVAIEPENPLAYFRRTCPGASIPAWLGMDFAETKAERKRYAEDFMESDQECVEFVVQLLPMDADLPRPTLADGDGDPFLPWEFRKPDCFPQSIAPMG